MKNYVGLVLSFLLLFTSSLYAETARVVLSVFGNTTIWEGNSIGDTYELPEDIGVSCGEKEFVGWSLSPINNGEKPSEGFYEKGANVVLSNAQTFYAVCADKKSGSGDYELVTKEYDDWSGEYLIVCDDYLAIGEIGGEDGLGAANNFVNELDEYITNKTFPANIFDECRVIIERFEGAKYGLKTQDEEYNYAENETNALKNTPSKNTAKNHYINIEYNSSEIQLKNKYGKYFCYSSYYNSFRFYTVKYKSVSLYRKNNDVTYSDYSTSLVGSELHVNDPLEISDRKEYDRIVVGLSGVLDIVGEGSIRTNELYVETSMGSGVSGQMKGVTNENLEVTGDAYVDVILGKNGDANQWHAFAVPFDVDAQHGVYSVDGELLTYGVHYAIMDYHGDIRANGEYGWKKYNGVLKPGNFYLMTVDGGRDTYRMKKLKEADIVSKHSVKVNAYNGVGETTDKGWNGVGNSCWTYVNVDCNIQVLNPETYTYELFVANSKDVAVGIPFFIQANSDKEIELSVSNENVLYSPARMNNAAIQMSISFGNKDYTDKLYVSISDDAESTYVIGNDLVKMSMTATPVVPQISAFAYDVRLCMVDLPWRHNEASVDLSLYAPCDGDYCLNGSDIYDVDVYLAYDGMIVGQVSDNEYYMPLKKGANSGYSLVIYRKNVSTDNMSNLSSVNHVKKLIYKGRLYVLYNNQVFDVQGNILKNEYE